MSELTQARLKALLAYCPDTGVFTRVLPRQGRKVGEVAGTPHNRGYVSITVDRRQYLAHRLAFLYMVGELPPEDMEVDHRNGRRDDNSWTNLRTVPKAVNMQNQRKAQANNSTGLLGVSPEGSRFRARIKATGATRSLGYFATPEEAHAAYLAAKRQLHTGCTI